MPFNLRTFLASWIIASQFFLGTFANIRVFKWSCSTEAMKLYCKSISMSINIDQ